MGEMTTAAFSCANVAVSLHQHSRRHGGLQRGTSHAARCHKAARRRCLWRHGGIAIAREAAIYHGERFNAWTHLVGAVLALAGAVWLQIQAVASGDAWKMVAVAVYGATLVMLYAVSTVYHSVRGRLKRLFQKLDHLSIYLLIAGSYTPFCLIKLRGPWGWSLLGIVWGLALLGMLQEIRQRSAARVLSLVIYGLMGWIVLVAIEPLLDGLGLAGFLWLAAGGVFYTVGIVFFAFDERFRHWHGIWHLFVIAGSLTHFIAILYYVL